LAGILGILGLVGILIGAFDIGYVQRWAIYAKRIEPVTALRREPELHYPHANLALKEKSLGKLAAGRNPIPDSGK
jgi:hypothetical protein